jgi:hypothetical protein
MQQVVVDGGMSSGGHLQHHHSNPVRYHHGSTPPQTPPEHDRDLQKIESKSEPSTEQVREKGKQKKVLTFRDDEELETVRAADGAVR